MVKTISTGIPFLDTFLEGGYETDAITTIFGPAGSGKTNLALLAAVGLAEKDKKVLFIDTEGGFSITRLKQLCADHKKVLTNIIFMKPVSFNEQTRSFERLSTIVQKSIALIIIDTISMLYRLERKKGDEFFDFNRELCAQIAKLTEITRKMRIPVLMTNQIYVNFKDNTIKMIGGDVLTYGSKCLLELQLAGPHRKLTLRKHRSIESGKSITFGIVAEGVREVSDANAQRA